ncbi:MAG: RNA pyrophosphohydrolase [Alphaproteobacteria bacterium]
MKERDMSYRINVGMMLVNAKNKIFVGQRIDKTTPAWQMPQGGVDPGEPYQAAAYRELIEEIGTDAFEFWYESQHWRTYDFPSKAPGQTKQPWGGKHKGQKQRWFLFRFMGEDKDICLETKHPEFSAWKWSTPEILIQEIVPFKREIYKAVLEEFLPIFSTYQQAHQDAR